MGSGTWGQKVGSTWVLNAFPIKVQILKSFTNFLEKTTDKVTNLGPALQFLRFSNYFSHSVGSGVLLFLTPQIEVLLEFATLIQNRVWGLETYLKVTIMKCNSSYFELIKYEIDIIEKL